MPRQNTNAAQAQLSRSLPRTTYPSLNPWSDQLSDGLTPNDRLFVHLLGRYRSHGGLRRAGHLVDQFDELFGGGSATVNRWLHSGALFSFKWESQSWIPMFQLAPDTLLPRPEVGRVASELRGAFDGWEIATWFVAPNNWLEGEAPISCVSRYAQKVLDTARADRFVALG